MRRTCATVAQMPTSKLKTLKILPHLMGMSLLDIISNEGVAAAIGALPSGMKGNQGAIAETIENNVRKKIIKDQHVRPRLL